MNEEDYEYLQWFYENADFGPAHEDVISLMNQLYVEETGNEVPEGYEVY